MGIHGPSHLLHYAERSTIHGIKDFLTTNNQILKVIWGVLLLGAAMLMCEEIYRTARNFASAPTAMELKLVDIDVYPTIHVCTNDWYYDAQARSLNFTDEDLAYISLTFFKTHDQDNSMASYRYIMKNNLRTLIDSQYLFQADPGAVEAQKETVKQKLKENNLTTVADVINIVSWNITVEAGLASPIIRKRWAPYGVMFVPGSVVCHTISNVTVKLEELIIIMQDGVKTGALVVGEDPFGQRHILTSEKRVSYKTYIWEIDKTSLLNKRREYCNESYSSRENCLLDCRIQMEMCHCNGVAIGVSYYNDESFWQILPAVEYCDPTFNESSTCQEGYDTCASQCKPCTVWNYQFTTFEEVAGITAFSRVPDWFAKITFKITTVKAMKVSTEYYTYPITSLLSNIGGLISLFCGASVISMVQLGLFWWGRGSHGKETRDYAKLQQEEEFHKWLHSALQISHCKRCPKPTIKKKDSVMK